MKWLTKMFDKQYETVEKQWEDVIKDMTDEEIKDLAKTLFIHQQMRLGEFI